jgi:DNA-binding LacI/PurR family transcriptional regulator
VVAYDDEFAGLFTPALTAVAPPRAAIGRTAVELLLQRLADPARPVHRVTVSPSLNVRASTAPPAAAS